MNKKDTTAIIDSRHLKILAAKKKDLEDSIVFVCLDEDKYGNLDKANFRKIVEQIDQIAPSGIYFPVTKNIEIQMYDKSEFRHKEVLVKINYDGALNKEELEKDICQAMAGAKDVKFVYMNGEIEIS